MTEQVQVALATYNGAAWLDQQLESIAAQSIPAEVIVGDDQSSDNTLGILNAWIDRMPGGMRVLPSVPGRLGAKRNFNRILNECHAPWVACCDQDDVWFPDHLERLCRSGPESNPYELVVGDLAVCNEIMDEIHPSFRAMQAFDAVRCKELTTLCVMNIFPGCAMAFRQPLLRLALPIPEEAILHDWWLALCASALGNLRVIEQPVGRYRLHAKNSIGAKRFTVMGLLRHALSARTTLGSELDGCADMAHTLLARHRERIPLDKRHTLASAVSLKNAGPVKRYSILRKSGIRRIPWQRQMKMILYG